MLLLTAQVSIAQTKHCQTIHQLFFGQQCRTPTRQDPSMHMNWNLKHNVLADYKLTSMIRAEVYAHEYSNFGSFCHHTQTECWIYGIAALKVQGIKSITIGCQSRLVPPLRNILEDILDNWKILARAE
jgi:hypothetical protein